MKNINIYHPYGDVGNLPWLNRQGGAIEFGAKPNSHQLLELSKKIKTFTEGTDPKSSEIEEIQSHMAQAERIVFLGFAFRKLNMQLITPVPPKDSSKGSLVRCYATTLRISDSDTEIIQHRIVKLYASSKFKSPRKVKFFMSNKSCKELFDEYWRGLSFA